MHLSYADVLTQEINLSFTSKFHMLHGHVHDVILKMNSFFGMGQDAIERWHQMRMRHHVMIIMLRSDQKQKKISSEV